MCVGEGARVRHRESHRDDKAPTESQAQTLSLAREADSAIGSAGFSTYVLSEAACVMSHAKTVDLTSTAACVRARV